MHTTYKFVRKSVSWKQIFLNGNELMVPKYFNELESSDRFYQPEYELLLVVDAEYTDIPHVRELCHG